MSFIKTKHISDTNKYINHYSNPKSNDHRIPLVNIDDTSHNRIGSLSTNPANIPVKISKNNGSPFSDNQSIIEDLTLQPTEGNMKRKRNSNTSSHLSRGKKRKISNNTRNNKKKKSKSSKKTKKKSVNNNSKKKKKTFPPDIV